MDNLMDLLKSRRTYRRFLQKEIPQETIDEILLAARLASSAANKQPLSYIVINGAEKVAAVFEHTRWAGALPPELGVPKEGERQNTDINPNCDTDAGLAISNMTLAAWNRGVGSCIIGACNKVKLSEMFGLSEKQKLHTVIAFGYPSHASSVVDLDEAGDIKYYLDENLDYMVPKRALKEVVSYL